ncbi:NIN-like protein [Artemisia annua]|uniref:NIN-like protein n=1 Tax=Artemisia annua TaxID=35608 RepID=A0A2U1MTL9_ARTAN|nr:NIN-like protein [Artemisia annua]
MCCALECELTGSLTLPVFHHPSDQSSSCVGFVEYSMKQACVLQVFSELKRALETVGLSTYIIYKNVDQKRGITIVYESHNFTLAQVWILYDNENSMQSSSSLDGTQTKRKFAVKLVGYFDNSDVDLVSSVKEYSDTCDMFPLKTGVGNTGKTLETCEPHFCRNITELTSDNGILALLSFANIEYSSFVICLRSGDVDYAFEFLWPQTHYYLIVFESLLTLKRCLPSFKFASGAKLCDELRVIDVDNPAGSGIGLFQTCKGNKLSSLEEDNTESSDHSVSSNNVTFSGNGKLVIKAEYGDHLTLLYLPSSSKLADIKQNIDAEYKLGRGSYTLEYFVKSDWRTLLITKIAILAL